MISAKLVQLIEEHSDRITDRVVRELRRDPRLIHLSRLPESDLRGRCQEILQRLGHWLTESNAEEIAHHFESIGRLRAREGVPLDEVVRGSHLLKTGMLDDIRDQGIGGSVGVFAEEELEHQVGGFFDSVVYHEVRGYQSAFDQAAASRAG
jgi:hypothetical protein